MLLVGVAVRSSRWTDRHSLGVLGGALVGHTVGGMAVTAFVERTVVDRIGLGVIAVVTVVAPAVLDRRVKELQLSS